MGIPRHCKRVLSKKNSWIFCSLVLHQQILLKQLKILVQECCTILLFLFVPRQKLRLKNNFNNFVWILAKFCWTDLFSWSYPKISLKNNCRRYCDVLLTQIYFFTEDLSFLLRNRDRIVTIPWPYRDRTVTVPWPYRDHSVQDSSFIDRRTIVRSSADIRFLIVQHSLRHHLDRADTVFTIVTPYNVLDH